MDSTQDHGSWTRSVNLGPQTEAKTYDLQIDHDPWIRSIDFGPQTHSLNQTMEEQERPQLGPSSVDLGPKTHSFNQTIKKQDAPILGPWSIDHINQSYPTDQFYESNNKGIGRTIVRTTLSGQISWILVHRPMLETKYFNHLIHQEYNNTDFEQGAPYPNSYRTTSQVGFESPLWASVQ